MQTILLSVSQFFLLMFIFQQIDLGGINAEDHLTDAFSNLPTSKIVQYQQMMKHSNQIPMCMSSSGSVFSDLVSNFIDVKTLRLPRFLEPLQSLKISWAIDNQVAIQIIFWSYILIKNVLEYAPRCLKYRMKQWF